MKAKISFIIYGAIAGVITILGFILWMAIAGEDQDLNMKYGELIGYTFMLLALSTVFFALRSFRDKNDGVLSFKEGFFNGMIIVLVASIIYVVGWMIYYPNFMPDFVDQYTQGQIAQLEAQGLSEEELKTKVDEMKAFQELYEQPLVMAGFTFMEIFPVGLIVTLISSLILKRKRN
ncbi:MAG: DUF4199 domain-containing protein [Cytophagales bacterium]|nr:DUF4199 domain-containing protein [Cytophagales bacterium]